VRRGDLVTVSLGGDYGKPRPAVIVQNDAVAKFDSVILCPFSSLQADANAVRPTVQPTADNSLRVASAIMVEKIITAPRHRVGAVIGRLSDEDLADLDRRLAFVLGLGAG
jgi:mRNA interferase MazF